MQHAYIVCDSKTGKTSIVFEEFISLEMALAVLDRLPRYHELMYGAERRGTKEKFGGKVAITTTPKRWLKELPDLTLDAAKSIAKAMEAELRETDEKILKTLKNMLSSPTAKFA